ncbi:DUF3047 domain-containing protein [Hahella ganghwensis]|uniref:DUF3047 domain-containing protein n=1 Tax=Hahella ganghwensis TaxID=286420 RepID=UPI00036E8E36|nr:DUF3047 domain-containing protein [Hahella ganghwensis]
MGKIPRRCMIGFCCFLFISTYGQGEAGSLKKTDDSVLPILGPTGLAFGENEAQLPSGWKPVTFPKISTHTIYQTTVEEGVESIKAYSNQSASGLIRELAYSTEQFPYLQWQWKISSIYIKGDYRKKSGDDYPARVYVTFDTSGVELSWWEEMQVKTYEMIYGERPPLATLSYIWANRGEIGTIADNPYTSRVKMIIVQSGNDNAGQWVSERRNLREDFKAAFGYEPPSVAAVAIMTDSDNTGEQTESWFGAIQATKGP